MREIGEQIKAIGEEADKADARLTELLLQIPNPPHPDCPVGERGNRGHMEIVEIGVEIGVEIVKSGSVVSD